MTILRRTPDAKVLASQKYKSKLLLNIQVIGKPYGRTLWTRFAPSFRKPGIKWNYLWRQDFSLVKATSCVGCEYLIFHTINWWITHGTRTVCNLSMSVEKWQLDKASLLFSFCQSSKEAQYILLCMIPEFLCGVGEENFTWRNRDYGEDESLNHNINVSVSWILKF